MLANASVIPETKLLTMVRAQPTEAHGSKKVQM
jgi:hypothetical protein